MQYIKKDLGSFNLHMIKTDKFKTMTVKVLFERPIKREDITFRNVLTDVMLLSTEDYKTKRQSQVEVCYWKRTHNTKFNWLTRKINWKLCKDYVLDRFVILNENPN